MRRRCGRVDVSGPGEGVSLDDGETIACERLLIAAGRMPTLEGLGLEQLGVEIGKQGIVVDEHLAAAETVWAIGDVTGVSLFTHVASTRPASPLPTSPGCAGGRLSRRPAVVFTDPQVAQVGTVEGDGLSLSSMESTDLPVRPTSDRSRRAL